MITIDYLRMEPADNGVMISYTEKTHKPSAKGETFSNCIYNDRKEVFEFDEDSGETEGLDKAMDRFKVLMVMAKKSLKVKGMM